MTTQPAHREAEAAADKDLSHSWVGLAQIDLEPKVAKHANLRGSFRAYPEPSPDDPEETVAKRIDVLDVICKGCRRAYEDVADAACEAKIDNTHLIGGNPGERKKRKVYQRPDNAVVMPGPRLSRRGVEAVVAGGAL